MRSTRAAARGLGSARHGTGHWILQRLTAIASVFTVLWFVAAMVSLSGAPYAEIRAWLGSNFNATMMILLVVSAYWHGALGLQTIIEDYVHGPALKLGSLVAVKLLAFALATSSIVAILKVAIGS